MFDYPVLDFRVVDGDNVECRLDQGFNCSIVSSCRIVGLDAPEKHSDAGKAVTKLLGKILLWKKDLRSVSVKKGKFAGRYIGDLYVGNYGSFYPVGWKLSEFLLENGLAKPYQGGKKEKWTEEELQGVEVKANLMYLGLDRGEYLA